MRKEAGESFPLGTWRVWVQMTNPGIADPIFKSPVRKSRVDPASGSISMIYIVPYFTYSTVLLSALSIDIHIVILAFDDYSTTAVAKAFLSQHDIEGFLPSFSISARRGWPSYQTPDRPITPQVLCGAAQDTRTQGFCFCQHRTQTGRISFNCPVV